MPTFVQLVPAAEDLLALEVEDLAGIVMEVLPDLLQNGHVHMKDISGSPFYSHQTSAEKYPPQYRNRVELAIAEAVSWLNTQGLIVQDPEQDAGFYRISRRGQTLSGRTAVESYRKARILPAELLSLILLEKVHPQFMRGDYDVAVFQAFKIVEVAVRQAANEMGAGYADTMIGVDLMRQAFHSERGPLTDKKLVPAEREAMSALFAGAIGHAKNPAGHRDVSIEPSAAARLIVFASHLISIIEKRLLDKPA
jgi:uncharacterized protein (TIGR02391 family)